MACFVFLCLCQLWAYRSVGYKFHRSQPQDLSFSHQVTRSDRSFDSEIIPSLYIHTDSHTEKVIGDSFRRFRFGGSKYHSEKVCGIPHKAFNSDNRDIMLLFAESELSMV